MIRVCLPTLLVALLLTACAGEPPYQGDPIARDANSIAIRIDTGEAFALPEGFTESPSAAGLALLNALIWQAGFPGFACEGELCGVVLLADLAVRATIAVAGTVQGYREAAALTEQARTRAELADAFRQTLELLDIAGELAGATAVELSMARPDTSVIPVQGSDAVDNAAQLSLRVTQFTFSGDHTMGSLDTDRYTLLLTVAVTLEGVNLPGAAYTNYFHFRSTRVPFDTWAANGAALFRGELERGYRQLAGDIVSEMFMIYRDDLTPGLPRTAYARGYFMQPIYPVPIALGLFNANPAEGFGTLVTSDVDNVSPELRWEAMPLRRSRGELPAQPVPHEPHRLEYDVRIYDMDGREIIRADGLQEARFQTTDLLPCALYRWTVRARLSIDGQTRVTDWNGGYNGFEVWNSDYPVPGTGSREKPTEYASRILYYYRFRTPSVTGSTCA